MNLQSDRVTVFIQNLQMAIERTGTNPKKLSLAAGLGETAVRDILTGRSGSPRIDTIDKLAEVLGVTVGSLINDDISNVDNAFDTLKEKYSKNEKIQVLLQALEMEVRGD